MRKVARSERTTTRFYSKDITRHSHLNEVKLVIAPQYISHSSRRPQPHYPPANACLNLDGRLGAKSFPEEPPNLALTDDDRAVPSVKLPKKLDAASNARQDEGIAGRSIAQRMLIIINDSVLSSRLLLFGRQERQLCKPFEQGLRKGKRTGTGLETAGAAKFGPFYDFFVGNRVEIEAAEGLAAVRRERAIHFLLAHGVEEQRQVSEFRRLAEALDSSPLRHLSAAAGWNHGQHGE